MTPQVSSKEYFKQNYDGFERFVSYFYQIDATQKVADPGSKILEIGKGNGFFSDYIKKLGFQVTTCDFDKALNPDVVADVRKLPFPDNSFDVVTIFEVLEHIPFEDFPAALEELKRVSRKNVIISVPYKSSYFEIVFRFPFARTIFKRAFLDLCLRIPLIFGGFEKSGQHYWEIDLWKTSLRRVRHVIKKTFKIDKEISPVLNHYHHFFILRK